MQIAPRSKMQKKSKKKAEKKQKSNKKYKKCINIDENTLPRGAERPWGAAAGGAKGISINIYACFVFFVVFFLLLFFFRCSYVFLFKPSFFEPSF